MSGVVVRAGVASAAASGPVLVEGYQDWECPECGLEERTPVLPPNSARMHDCPKLHGLVAPLVRAGTDCRLVAVERGDYLHGDEQRTGDDGIPYMAVVTERADGSNDVLVFAPPATAKLGG